MVAESSSERLNAILTEEKTQSEREHEQFISQISESLSQLRNVQQQRLQDRVSTIQEDVTTSKNTFETEHTRYNEGMESWLRQNKSIQESLAKSRESIKAKVKKHWTVSYLQRVFHTLNLLI